MGVAGRCGLVGLHNVPLPLPGRPPLSVCCCSLVSVTRCRAGASEAAARNEGALRPSLPQRATYHAHPPPTASSTGPSGDRRGISRPPHHLPHPFLNFLLPLPLPDPQQSTSNQGREAWGRMRLKLVNLIFRRRHRKKGNRVGPATDGYDSTDQHTRHKPPLSRQSRHGRGRSQRGRPFTQQSLTDGGGRASRSVAKDTQHELAWMDTGGGGVQLMRFQPIPPPTYSLPPHPPPPAMQPQGASGVIQVQPRPQKGAGSTSLAQEKLPTLSGPQNQSYTQKQLETYFKVCCGNIRQWNIAKQNAELAFSRKSGIKF